MNSAEQIRNLFESVKKPLLLDGAMGSLLTSSGLKWDANLWSSYGNISNPDSVIELHRKYIEAGADIITSNTFRTNPLSFFKSNIDIPLENFIKIGVDLARKSLGSTSVFVAGSNAPAEDCYQANRTVSLSDLEYNHKKHIEVLYESGSDFILNETQSHLDEIEIICDFCHENKIPFAVSLFFTENSRLLSGEKVDEVVNSIKNYSPLFIGFNCVSFDLFKIFSESNILDFPWGLYLNCGSGKLTDKNISCGVSPSLYTEELKEVINSETKVIGSCCGSSPAHTKELRNIIDEIY